MSFLAYSKHFQGVADILLRDPVRYLPFAQLLDGIMSTESELTQAQREMIALYSSRLNHCGYCVDSHSCVLTGLGTDETLVNALADGSTEPVDDNLQRLFAFAGKLTLEPGKVSRTDIDAVRAAGWNDQTIEDVIGVVATFAFLNRLVDGFGIEGTDDHFRQVGGMVSQQGYAPLVQMIRQKADAGRA
ncbi:MAG TPA: hypothetical protein ENI74_00745 [Gammaproteobacteria bacterium]|nr:hypothetical protein [Gammaproteobacteria bacterium]